jgi:hypothetical protein
MIIDLNDSEQRIWEAAYAAAWVRSFQASYDARIDAVPSDGHAFEHTLHQDHAEQAAGLADAAVAQLRQYRRGAPLNVNTRWSEPR